AETGANTGADNSTTAHMRNWMECVRSRKTPNADIHAAYNHSVALCMTIAALHTGKRVTFDEQKQDVVAGEVEQQRFQPKGVELLKVVRGAGRLWRAAGPGGDCRSGLPCLSYVA